MKLFDYSELIRVIDNVEIREQNEKDMALNELKKKYSDLKRNILASGILNDWNELKKLCSKAKVRLCVSHVGNSSIGCILNHKDGFSYCKEYSDNGTFSRCMSNGSSWSDYFGFIYDPKDGLRWNITHTSTYHGFNWFHTQEEEYETKINILETFINTYEIYRDFQLKKIKEKFQSRIEPEDILK